MLACEPAMLLLSTNLLPAWLLCFAAKLLFVLIALACPACAMLQSC
jgi:hypothetical protein